MPVMGPRHQIVWLLLPNLPAVVGEPSCVTRLLQTADWPHSYPEPPLDFARDLARVSDDGLRIRAAQYARQCATTLALARRWSLDAPGDSCDRDPAVAGGGAAARDRARAHADLIRRLTCALVREAERRFEVFHLRPGDKEGHQRDGMGLADFAARPVRAVEAPYLFFIHGLLRCGTCLLYTSPSPRDRTRSRMPSSA